MFRVQLLDDQALPLIVQIDLHHLDALLPSPFPSRVNELLGARIGQLQDARRIVRTGRVHDYTFLRLCSRTSGHRTEEQR